MFSLNNRQLPMWVFIIASAAAMTFTALLAVSYFEFEQEKNAGQEVKMLRVVETVWRNDRQLCQTRQ